MNRIDRRDEIAGSDIEKLFNCAVDARIPERLFFAASRGHARPAGGCHIRSWAKPIEALAGKLTAPSVGRRAARNLEAWRRARRNCPYA